ncbi:nuclear transport factor 2 family protein [Streptococcus sp. H31]|uniref:nuclear transport factor 2 family protein n=1 Tax=Streptococcus huangxiaojuni TaxID=3237239 RepID=UPI0034A46ED0
MSDQELLKNLYRQVNQAMVAKDTAALRELLQPDTVLVHMSGYIQPVAEWLSQIETGEMVYYSWKEEAIKNLVIDGNKASLIGQSRVKAKVWGSGPHTWPLQIKMFFEKVGENWKITKQIASTY